MSLPQWLLLVSSLLALAVSLAVLARRVRLPPTVGLADVGFVAAWVDRSVGAKFPLEGEQFEEVSVGQASLAALREREPPRLERPSNIAPAAVPGAKQMFARGNTKRPPRSASWTPGRTRTAVRCTGVRPRL